MPPSVVIVHDYLTQRGGAERVVLSMLKAFPGAPLYTSLYAPEVTFREFREIEVRTLPINRVPTLRRVHRLAMPLLAPAFSALTVTADIVLCSSSGWAHGATVRGRKVVYCHTPARWLYQPRRYLRGAGYAARAGLAALRPYLTRWDQQAAASAERYLTNSQVVRERIRDIYGIDAEVLPPPPGLDPNDARSAVDGIDPGYLLSVSRLLPYKNLDAIVSAFGLLPGRRLVLVGDGPLAGQLKSIAPDNVTFLSQVTDAQLRWLYAQSSALIAASYEDFGLTPLEAGVFGKPAVVLRWGGFLDTMVDGVTGFFFATPTREAIACAVERLKHAAFEPKRIRAHAALYSERRFIEGLRLAMSDTGARAEGPESSSTEANG
jgi:glycosyltransferase involved in cell wall biosynthesis